MNPNPSVKNYYNVLGVAQGATLFEIENAYQRLAAKWHPDKHKEHRKTAEARFKEISEAFDILSDHNKRAHYDEILNREYSLADATSTFDRFFNEHGFADENEEKFFDTHYPSPLTNYYNTLGVKKNATLEDIKTAYRKLALQYHPKNNPGNEEANKKFVEVNEAYNALSSEFKRQNYDNIMFGTIAPIRAHNIFDDFFGTRPSLLDDDFRPFFHNRWSRDLDRMMVDEGDERGVKDGQTIKTSSVYTNKDGQETAKTITSKKFFKGGRTNEEKIEDYLFPSGERKVVKTTNIDGKLDTKEYKLKKGEELPKELTQTKEITQ